MTPKQAKASRRESIMSHCSRLIDQKWPVPTEEMLKDLDSHFQKLTEAADRWIAFANRETDLMPDESTYLHHASAIDIRFKSFRKEFTQINASAKAAIQQLIAEHKPRRTPRGIKLKIPPVHLSDEHGRSVTISDLWTLLECQEGGNWEFRVQAAKPENIPAHRQGYCHPHVKNTSGLPCMGSVALYYRQAMNDGRFLDAFDMLSDALENYNGNSPYIYLDQFVGVKCPKCTNIAQRLLNAELVRGSDRSSVKVCDQCIKQCRNCSTPYSADSDPETFMGRFCYRCGKKCQKCGGFHSKMGRCQSCSKPCPRCDQYKSDTETWYVIDHSQGIDIRVRCSACVAAYRPGTLRFPFSANDAVDRFGSWSDVLARENATTLFREAQDAHAQRAAGSVG